MNLIEILHPTVSWIFNPKDGRIYVEGVQRNQAFHSNGKSKAGAPVRTNPLEQTRTCTKCRVKMSLENFAVNKAGRNGRHASCKECRNKAERSRLAVKKQREVAL